MSASTPRGCSRPRTSVEVDLDHVDDRAIARASAHRLSAHMDASLSVLGTPLKPCSHAPITGWFRDGCCNTDPSDGGSHTVCAVLTDDFLECLREMGNDLVTPAPQHAFPGLTAGDRWCVCAASWAEAARRSRACPVDLEATHARALKAVSLDVLMAHATGGIEA